MSEEERIIINNNDNVVPLTLGNLAYLLLFLSSCLPSLAKYFYMSYRLLIGTLYPAYLSYKALKHQNESECNRLIMYWIVFSVFSIVEGFLDIFIGFWLPFYYESKVIFIFWLISPYGNGARILYENFIIKKFEEHEDKIDEWILNIKQFSIDIILKIWEKLFYHFNRILIMSITRAQLSAIQYIHNQHDPFNFSIMEKRSTNLACIEATPTPTISLADDNDKDDTAAMGTETTEVPESYGDTTTDEQQQQKQQQSDKKPLRRTKRKRKVMIIGDGEEEDNNISTINRPVTRSTRSKATSSDTDFK